MAGDQLQFEISKADAGPHELLLSGHVTGDGLREAGCDLTTLFGADVYDHAVLIDMRGTEFLDSSGIGWLLEQHKRFRSGSGRLVLHSVPPMVSKVMQLMSLHRVLKIADDAKAARLLAEATN